MSRSDTAGFSGRSPPVESTLKRAPDEVKLYFTERLEAAYCTVRVEDGRGVRVDRRDGHVDRSNPVLLRATLSTLVPDVMAVEPDGSPVRGPGSQLGWLLWADALEPAARDAAAERLCAPDVLTGHGLRTLSSESPVFAPDAYHRGAVWPFDSWLGWGGLRAAGRATEAERVRRGVLDALEQLGRSPELYAVSGDGLVEPVALSNRVQAWTVGAQWALAHEWDGRGAS